jgi:hypothetical protein
MSFRNKAQSLYRKKAAFCRAMENEVTRPDIRQALQDLAVELEAAADHIERKGPRSGTRLEADKPA